MNQCSLKISVHVCKMELIELFGHIGWFIFHVHFHVAEAAHLKPQRSGQPVACVEIVEEVRLY